MPYQLNIQLRGIIRFNLVTPDLSRLAAFYRDVLHLAPIGTEQTISPSEIALLGLQGTGRRQIFAVGGQHLAIDQFSHAGRLYPAAGDAASLWFQHFALVVDDIATAYAQLHKVSPISSAGPQHLPQSSGGVWAYKFRDPDGHPLELLQGSSVAHPKQPVAMVHGIDHSAISVADVNASDMFYRDLGLEPGARSLNKGPEQERLDGLPAVQVDVAPMMPPAPAPHLELLGYRVLRGARDAGRLANDTASTRIIWRGSLGGVFRDPDGHMHHGRSRGAPMSPDASLAPGRLLRRAGPPDVVADFPGVQIDDDRLADVLSPDATLLCLYAGALHAEGPVWLAAEQRLYWSDVSNRRLLVWHPDGEVTVALDATHFINGNAFGPDGHLVHCEHGRRCISRSDGSGQAVPFISRFDGRRLNSPNDVTVAADGAIWFTDPIFGLTMPSQGSLAEPELDHRSVYRVDHRTGQMTRMADFEQPNGLGFSPDGKTLYVSDTARALLDTPGRQAGRTHDILAFDVAEDGRLSNRRFFYHTDHGVPDGLTVDSRGWVWTTAADGIHVIAPDRTRLGYIPTQSVTTNCTFGGEGGNRLFITATDTLLAIDLTGPA